jgi:hypothetical protein
MVQIGRGQALTSPKMQTLDTLCRYCCKSPKLPGANFPAARQSDPRPSIDIASITFPRSPVSLSLGDESPTSLHESRVYGRENFWSPVQKDFCNKICHKPTHAVQQNAHSITSTAVASSVVGDGEAEGLHSGQVDDEIEFSGLLDREVGWLNRAWGSARAR